MPRPFARLLALAAEPSPACALCRRRVRAYLVDAETSGPAPTLAAAYWHLHRCRRCSRWFDRAILVPRLTRILPTTAAPAPPDPRLAELLARL
jgi:predicted anti-sigma-YlaC factor YlaD